jgi:hypothetical protein
MDKIVFGSDPEGFYARKGEDGKDYVVPPAKYRLDYKFPTDNTDPKHPVFKSAEGQNGVIKLIEDGAAFELTVPPSTEIETLYQDIQLGYELAKDVGGQFGNHTMITPTINYDVDEFKGRERAFRQCLIFGCDPDEDVFETQGLLPHRLNQMARGESALEHPYRYGGGHLHVSGCENFQVKPLLSIKMFAFLLGNLVTFMSPMKELDHLRTYRYGRPGRFRIQRYGKKFQNLDWTDQGLEYRTPSNAWTTDLSLGKKMAFAVKTIAEYILPDDKLMEVLIEDLQDNTIKAVMEGLPELAETNYKAVMSMVY